MNLLHAPEKVWQSQNVPFNKFKCAGKSQKHIYPKQGLLFCFIEMVDDFFNNFKN